ncbi:NAD(P)H-dependent oxidoreductase [Psychroserpens damuponensis]|uniref:NAD(P)H-dependent oxidoreductase n=1 Tax=Psychroserpens damuponensis TaxID=943936 RepID=UPI00058B109A|nr:NAD(P)H-dependent oxidoreductase [Psychroserpens damuponensis]
MNTINQLKWRYATKKFDASKVLSEEKLNILKQAFNLTATSFGLQTISLLIIKDRILRQDLVPHSYNQRQVVDASHLLVICIEDNITDTNIDIHFNNVKQIRETPEAILKPFRDDLKQMMQGKTVKERQEWSLKQAYIALGNLMTVCAVESIDSCPMEGFNPAAFDEVLNLKEKNLKSVLLLPVGFRANDDMFSGFKKVRKQLNDAVIEM